jgi:hypothetical protein
MIKKNELGYRCATTASFKDNYKYNIQKTFFEFVTERNICDGKENVCDGKDILVYNNNYQHKSNARS